MVGPFSKKILWETILEPQFFVLLALIHIGVRSTVLKSTKFQNQVPKLNAFSIQSRPRSFGSHRVITLHQTGGSVPLSCSKYLIWPGYDYWIAIPVHFKFFRVQYDTAYHEVMPKGLWPGLYPLKTTEAWWRSSPKWSLKLSPKWCLKWCPKWHFGDNFGHHFGDDLQSDVRSDLRICTTKLP